MPKNILEKTKVERRKGTANEKSFGLGLSISRQIVEEHGGRIGLKIINHQAARFSLHCLL